MSSFASRAREEIATRSIQKDCCVRAAAYGIACFAKYFDAKGLVLMEAITIPYLPQYAFLQAELPKIGEVRGAMASFCARSSAAAARV